MPLTTYRLQMNAGFGFDDARRIVPYLQRLGISDLYLSPILQARGGSTHGYDVTDPARLNADLGSESAFLALSRELRRRGMGILLDIVPNHMAAHSENPWWRDLLELGPASPYADFFDVDWTATGFDASAAGKVLLPILGDHYGRVLERGELRVDLEPSAIVLRYFDWRLPLTPPCWRSLFGCGERAAGGRRTAPPEALVRLAEDAARIFSSRSTRIPPLSKRKQLQQRCASLKRRLSALLHRPHIRAFLRRRVQHLNGRQGQPSSFDSLDQLLGHQFYKLAYWRTAADVSDYRRFFDISELVGLRTENPRVFAASHVRILDLVRSGHVTGLRIDHIDGLRNPAAYLRRLQTALRKASRTTTPFYVIVEKILAGDETLPTNWQTHGTTGYEFLNAAHGVLFDRAGLERMYDFYAQQTGSRETLADATYRYQKLVLRELLAADLRRLAGQLAGLAAHDRHARDLSFGELEAALAEVTARLPAYRSYITSERVRPEDRSRIRRAVTAARRERPDHAATNWPALDLVERVLRLNIAAPKPRAPAKCLAFVSDWQQFTGAVMAKGVEDTAFYRFAPLVSLNAVGADSSDLFAYVGPDQFHRRMVERAARTPAALNASSTHDTKRSEDVRARISVLAERPDWWERHARRWIAWNAAKKPLLRGQPVPTRQEELFLYQTLLGAWPLHAAQRHEFRSRLRGYVIKALRESKANTAWLRVDEPYERAVVNFVEAILAPSHRFLADFLRLERRTRFFGMLNSLSQLLLKCTAPGIPDFYQGCELWDLSLVDPDNRRPVDFGLRRKLLDGVIADDARSRPALLMVLRQHWQDGRIKLWLIWRLLQCRQRLRELFTRGDYVSLRARGSRAHHVHAFARRLGKAVAVVVTARLVSRLVRTGVWPTGTRPWKDTELALPTGVTGWVDALTGKDVSLTVSPHSRFAQLAGLFSRLPFALLVAHPRCELRPTEL